MPCSMINRRLAVVPPVEIVESKLGDGDKAIDGPVLLRTQRQRETNEDGNSSGVSLHGSLID